MNAFNRWPGKYLPFCALAALALAGCGNGSGDGSSGGPPPSYAVNGTVSGMLGTGLILRNNGGDDTSVAANGGFAFSTLVASGSAYNVTVSTQPTSPAQTCVVSNGSGTMGSSNVTNVTVSCATAGFTGFLSGPFRYTDVSSSGAGSGTDAFDGAGSFTENYVLNSSGVISSGSFSVPYTAAAGGMMKMGDYDGVVSASGNTLLVANLVGGSPPYVDIDIKQGQSNFTNANFTGIYQLVSITSTGDAGASLYITADGAGNYSGTADRNDAGVLSSTTVSGTYTVAADGTLILTPATGSPLTGGLSADGKTLVLSQLTDGQPAEFSVGVKQGQASFTNANVSGTYGIIDYANSGQASGLLTFYFDGAGNFQGTGTFNDSGTISSFPINGVYTVADDGTFTLTPDGGSPFTGGVSMDGNTLVFTWMQAGYPPETDVGVRM